MSDIRETLNHIDTLARDALERAGKATGAGSTSSIVVQPLRATAENGRPVYRAWKP